jgi:hypothetical protein
MKDKEKFANNTGVYSQGFPQYFAEFVFLNLMGIDSPRLISERYGQSRLLCPYTYFSPVNLI